MPPQPAVADCRDGASVIQASEEADLERRFGSLRRLHGDAGYARLRAARVAVIGLGGVGSWAVEAMARCGVARLTLIDLDHVAESNVNRQIQATSRTLGQSKALALQERVFDIHPGCRVHCVEEFVDATNWPGLLAEPVDVVIEACDQVKAKAAVAAWSLSSGTPVVVVGAAGGKSDAAAVAVSDLAEVTHDPLLASLRQRLRQQHGAARHGLLALPCVHSREAIVRPEAVCDADGALDHNLNCHGYGSSVVVTATFGMVAAGVAVRMLLARER